ncbi:MAG TPA: hypothetical protein VLA71_19280, partial [Algoriphagus sp.]|nr:hypothetical protein [Algoriphagus sp.]
MNKLINKLPLLAFVLAAFAALAFNFPDKENTSRYGSHDSKIYDVTNVDMGSAADEYQCNGETGECLFEDEELENHVPNSWGEFDPGEALVPIN